MNANLKLQAAGLANRAGILIGAADMIDQYAQLTAGLLQEIEALTVRVAELEGQVKANQPVQQAPPARPA